jgi:tetratricopeptide (TPR) repeat protein
MPKSQSADISKKPSKSKGKALVSTAKAPAAKKLAGTVLKKATARKAAEKTTALKPPAKRAAASKKTAKTTGPKPPSKKTAVSKKTAKPKAVKKTTALKPPVKRTTATKSAVPKAVPNEDRPDENGGFFESGIDSLLSRTLAEKAIAVNSLAAAEIADKLGASFDNNVFAKAGDGDSETGQNGASDGAEPEYADEALQTLNKAIAAGIGRDYKSAVEILAPLTIQYECPPEAYLFLGRALHMLKQYSWALAAFNDFIRLMPHSPEGYLFAGRTYLALGMPQRAAAAIKKTLEYKPGDAMALALLGTAYLRSRHSQLAVDSFQQAVEAAPENQRIYRAYLNALLIRGIRVCRMEDFQLGIQMLSFVLENGLDIPLVRLELGRACRETGKLDEALEHYSAALRFNPRDLRIRWYRASILMVQGMNREALEEISIIKSQDGRLPDLPWNSELVDMFIIRSCLEGHEWRRAADSCGAWLKTRGPNPMIHALYAEACRNLRNYTAAANHLERALELSPDEQDLWHERLMVAWESADWKTLRYCLRKLQELGGDETLIRRFTVLLEARTEEDDKKTITILQNAIRSLGPEAELMYGLGERYLKVGLLKEALPWFRKIIFLNPQHERAYLAIIAAAEALYKEEGNEAIGLLNEAYGEYLRHWPDNHNLRREWALYLIRNNDFSAASRELEALLPWEPVNPTLRRILAYAYRKIGRYQEAAVFLKGLLKEKPRDMAVLLEYASCLDRAGAPHYAKTVLEKAAELLKNPPEVLTTLGMLYFREGKTEEAFVMLREAAAKDSRDPRPYKAMAFITRKLSDKAGAAKYEQEAKLREEKNRKENLKNRKDQLLNRSKSI